MSFDFFDSRVLIQFGRPVGGLNAELLGVLRVQPLPTLEFHFLAADDAADRLPSQKPVEGIQKIADGTPGYSKCQWGTTNVSRDEYRALHIFTFGAISFSVICYILAVVRAFKFRGAQTMARLRMRSLLWGALLTASLGWLVVSLAQAHDAARAVVTPHQPVTSFTAPVLVKNSPTNLRYFDVSWNDNSKQRYYLADRTNNAIDVVDSATDTFLGFIGKGHYTGSRPCPNNPKDMRLCAGPSGVVTDDLGHVWSGDGDANVIEANDVPGTTIIRSIPTHGNGRIDELAYDPIDQIVMAENDGDTPPYVVFVSVESGSIIGRYVYPKNQDGMEQPAWDRQTRLFYQNVPGQKNRLDVFDPHHLPKPIKSFPVECSGGLLGLTLSGLTVGPNWQLMTVCGSVGGVTIDSRNGKLGKPIPEGGDADEVWYDPGSGNYYFSRNDKLAVVSAATEKFVAYIPLGSHSVAANAKNRHVFVPVAGKGIFVVTPRRTTRSR